MQTNSTPRLTLHAAPLSQAQADKISHLIIALPKLKEKQAWPDFPYADVLKRRLDAARAHDEALTQFNTDLPNALGTHVTLGLIDADISAFELLTLARKLTAAQREQHAARSAVYLPGMEPALAARVAEALLAALLAGAYKLPQFKSKPDESPTLTHIDIYGLKSADFRRTYAEAAGNNLARHLTTLPPNELTPALYRKRIAALAKQHGWRMEFLDIKKLKQKKAGAFLAVAQGSPVPDAGIVHLHYQPAKATKKPALALVGKGICFDTGGTNLKQAKHMYGMHEDMEGSAVALGTLLALTELKVDFPIDCWLALAQNHIGPNAYKQNDVVTACNGITIEVVHTDAEGRMVLADTLALASREKPQLIIDYATLTGTCVYALGTIYSGAFTNRADLMPTIIKTGCASGERVWPFPNDSDYDTELDSQIADIKQCKMEGEADHILASRFLNRFVDKTIPWIHIDLSAGNHKGGLAHIPTDITGFGVRYTLNLLLEQKVLDYDKV
ncbi:MAG: leucyl aminopeptidase family protein [Pseudomonadota bacterium]